MTTYSVSMSNVGTIADEMGVIARQIQAMVSDLDSSTTQSLSEWTSSARDVYNQAKAKWDAAAGDLAVQATNAQNALSQINDSYATAEYRGLGLWS